MTDATLRSRARRVQPLSLPNLLTYGRIAAVPAYVAAIMFLEGEVARWTALGVFVLASLTDWLDGYLARAFDQQSAIGRMLDPIADKLLVGAALLMLVQDRTIAGVSVLAALVILCREILVSGLREYLAGVNVKLHVTRLAKWKTVGQMTALALLTAGPAGDAVLPGLSAAGLVLLWLSALLTLWTGYGYLHAGIQHAVRE